MLYPSHIRKAKSVLAHAVRDHGANSPEHQAARREFAALKFAHNIAVARDEVGGFTPEQTATIVAALTK